MSLSSVYVIPLIVILEMTFLDLILLKAETASAFQVSELG